MGIECVSVVTDCFNQVSIILKPDFLLHLGLQKHEDGAYSHLELTQAIENHSRQKLSLLFGLENTSLEIIADGTYFWKTRRV